MADIRRWDGIVVTFKEGITPYSWVIRGSTDEDIESIDYLCYRCYLSFPIRKLDDNQKLYNRVEWSNEGHDVSPYTMSCNQCRNYLDVHTAYCCIDHQILISPASREETLKIMVDQIVTDKTLCPFMTIQAIHFYDFKKSEIKELIDIGEKHISLFITTPAGLLLQSEIEGDSSL